MSRTDLEQVVYQMSADLSLLTKQNDRALGIVKTKTREMQHEYNKVDPGKALERVFSRARLSVIEEGGAKIGIFGSAIEELGVAGIAGAAGIAALAVAFERAHAAAEWADSVEKAADKIGVTTTALQEFDHVATQADIPIEAFRDAMSKANSVLGAFQSNVGDARAKKAFAAIGISKEQARSFDNISEALPLIIDRIARLGSVAEKAKIADALGLEPLLPVILKGRDAFEALKDEAHKYGLIVEEDVIHRSAEAADKMKLAAEIADKNLKSVFIDLAPAIAGVTMEMAGMVRQLAQIIEDAPLAWAGLKSLVGLGDVKLPKLPDVDGLAKAGMFGPAGIVWAGLKKTGGPAWDALVKQGKLAGLHGGIQDLMAGKPVDMGGLSADPKAASRATGLIPDKDAVARANAARARIAKGLEGIDQATKEELAAQAALVTGARQLADLQMKEIDAELKRKNDKVDDEFKANAINEGDAKRIKQLNETAASEKRTAIARGLEATLAEDTITSAQRIAAYYDEIANINLGMATSSRKRLDIEMRLLADRQRNERERLASDQDAARRGKSGEDLAQLVNQQRADTAAQGDLHAKQREGAAYANRSPIQAYTDSLKDLSDVVENEAISAFRSFADSIGDTTAKLLHLKGPFGQFVGQILSLMVQRQGSGLLGLLHIPGFASGTSSAPGGLSIIGENGPELMNLPRGAQIMPNALLQSLQAGLNVGGGGGRLDYHVHIDLTGANGDQTIRKIAYEAAAQGSALAYSAAMKDIPARMTGRAANRLGR